ncbi:MAG TPA: SDR family NAD(P)-dependent oxidoreductase [Synergistaceae bacterium]|nr:SDR family NAD(P)-dependent oxidoreductase [Synergistaceae bacterium]
MFDFSGKSVLVTGGSRGLGRALVRAFCAAGAAVGFTFRQEKEAAARLQGELEEGGGRVRAFQADVTSFARAAEVVAELGEAFGEPEVLVCNAGVARSAPIWKMTEEDWDVAVDTSLKGAFNYLRAVAPVFVRRHEGKVLCVGSINGLRGRMGTLSYNVAKAGLVGLVKTAAAELGRYNVNVNAIAPGFIDTESQERTPEIIRDLVLKECAIKRLGTEEDMVPLVLFLCSDLGRHITGQTIRIDAGQYL